jgi:hypothetical protein
MFAVIGTVEQGVWVRLGCLIHCSWAGCLFFFLWEAKKSKHYAADVD